MTNLAQRTITGLLGAAIMIGALLWNEYSFGALFLLIAIMSLLEFYKLAEGAAIKPQKWTGLLAGILLFILIYALSIRNLGLSVFALSLIPKLFLPLIFLIFIVELYRNLPQPFTNIAFTLLGILYLPFTLALTSFIATAGADRIFHPEIMLGYFLILWANDTGAYFAGKKFGKTKLFERISPKKSWQGSAGGAVLAFTVAHFIANQITVLTRPDWVVITALIIVFGTFGDLVESMFKRSLNIKDSGTLIPGHGGFLDRFDGLFISSPFVFSYLFFMY